MSKGVTSQIEAIDLLGETGGIELRGLGESEFDGSRRWAWALGPELSARGDQMPYAGWHISLALVVPKRGTEFSLLWNGAVLASISAPVDNYKWQWEGELPYRADAWQLSLRASAWNSAQFAFAPLDHRPLAFLVEEFRLREAGTLTGRICPYPFSRMETPGAPFVPCCDSWLTKDFLSLDPGPDPWNGPAAQALRESMYEGNLKYCRLERCGIKPVPLAQMRNYTGAESELPIAPTNLAALMERQTAMPEGPAALTVMGDPRCNLACGSCRPAPIQRATPSVESSLERSRKLISLHGPRLRILKLAGDGEIFFSPDLRDILRGLSPAKFPLLEKVDVLTNGVLFDAEALEALQPGSAYIRSVNVSLDAGDEETYALVRGGDWRRLQKNLSWMAGLRASGRFDFLALTFVARAENFHSLPAFLELASALKADEVYVSQLFPWDRMGITFAEEAVHLENHPRHAEFRQLWNYERNKKRNFRWRTNIG